MFRVCHVFSIISRNYEQFYKKGNNKTEGVSVLGKEVFTDVEDDNIKDTSDGEGKVDGDVEDTQFCKGDYHCEDYGDSSQE